MREKLEKMIGVKASSRRDEDIVSNMTALVREKDAMIDRLRAEIASLIVSQSTNSLYLFRPERKSLRIQSQTMT